MDTDLVLFSEINVGESFLALGLIWMKKYRTSALHHDHAELVFFPDWVYVERV